MERKPIVPSNRRPYSIKIGTMSINAHTRGDGSTFYRISAQAAWLSLSHHAVSLGEIWDYQDLLPRNEEEFLTEHTNGRYGGSCSFRYSKENGVWSKTYIEVSHADRLKQEAMNILDSYPNLLAGWDGWWYWP